MELKDKLKKITSDYNKTVANNDSPLENLCNKINNELYINDIESNHSYENLKRNENGNTINATINKHINLSKIESLSKYNEEE